VIVALFKVKYTSNVCPNHLDDFLYCFIKIDLLLDLYHIST
jgi:hypothetical protein